MVQHPIFYIFNLLLNDIKEDKHLLEVFDEQTTIWWNKKDLIKIISNLYLSIVEFSYKKMPHFRKAYYQFIYCKVVDYESFSTCM